MKEYKVIQVKQSVLADNDADVNKLRMQLKKQGTVLLNLMSLPGLRKTTTLKTTMEKPIDFIRLIKNSTSKGGY